LYFPRGLTASLSAEAERTHFDHAIRVINICRGGADITLPLNRKRAIGCDVTSLPSAEWDLLDRSCARCSISALRNRRCHLLFLRIPPPAGRSQTWTAHLCKALYRSHIALMLLLLLLQYKDVADANEPNKLNIVSQLTP